MNLFRWRRQDIFWFFFRNFANRLLLWYQSPAYQHSVLHHWFCVRICALFLYNSHTNTFLLFLLFHSSTMFFLVLFFRHQALFFLHFGIVVSFGRSIIFLVDFGFFLNECIVNNRMLRHVKIRCLHVHAIHR